MSTRSRVAAALAVPVLAALVPAGFAAPASAAQPTISSPDRGVHGPGAHAHARWVGCNKEPHKHYPSNALDYWHVPSSEVMPSGKVRWRVFRLNPIGEHYYRGDRGDWRERIDVHGCG